MIFQPGEIHEVRLICGWDRPLATAKHSLGGWENFVPEFRLVAPYRPKRKPAGRRKTDKPGEPQQMDLDFGNWKPEPKKPAARASGIPTRNELAEQKRRAFDSFRFSLPREVAAVLEPFRSHQWPMIEMLWHDRRTLDLAQSNPLLAQAIAHWRHSHPNTPLKLGTLKQRQLLALLKLPDTAAVTRIIRKIPPESYDPENWASFSAALRNADSNAFRMLAHAPTINRGVMDLALRPRVRDLVTPLLIEEAASRPSERYRAAIAEEIAMLLAMADQCEAGLDRMLPSRFNSTTQIHETHQTVLDAYQRIHKAEACGRSLPPPPLPGIPGRIQPILSMRELHEEGRVQHNCVAGYGEAVCRRDCFIYRVLEPQRCTLAIRRGPSGDWEIQELKATCNEQPSPEAREAVREWLDPYRLGV